jgi:hypothetical protein
LGQWLLVALDFVQSVVQPWVTSVFTLLILEESVLLLSRLEQSAVQQGFHVVSV